MYGRTNNKFCDFFSATLGKKAHSEMRVHSGLELYLSYVKKYRMSGEFRVMLAYFETIDHGIYTEQDGKRGKERKDRLGSGRKQ
jgi:hypothetical protein